MCLDRVVFFVFSIVFSLVLILNKSSLLVIFYCYFVSFFKGWWGLKSDCGRWRIGGRGDSEVDSFLREG